MTPSGQSILKPASASDLYDLVRTTIAVLGVLTIGGAAAVAYRRQETLEKQRTLDEQSQRHTRYQQGATQLGHDEPIIRIAAIYALEALAVEWANTPGCMAQRDQCIDLLVLQP